jgi:hypothetical protein
MNDERATPADSLTRRRFLAGAGAILADGIVAGLDALYRARSRWPDAVESFIGLTVGIDALAEAFSYRAVKATLTLDDR